MKRKLLLYVYLALWLVGCRTQTVYVPVESQSEQRDSTIVRDSVDIKEKVSYRDSTVIKDSTVIVMDAQGNVTRMELYRERNRYRELYQEKSELQAKYDSLLSVKNKEIQVPYPVEKKLTRWQQIKMDAGGYAISLLAVAGIIGLSYCVRWLIRQKR
ncbi:hypothetical protein PN597_15635 [Parabacteroides merdae]|uniref:hypothetical protein n=1 Tax=Parabacteroides merdae TaxID=46503 RepID=UPI00189844CB|nr:hypothetical protein [Parabacteroides merdae]MDB9116745.1 hypothetical protein [Parabacteroides merdae]